jgi:hypothetical protein
MHVNVSAGKFQSQLQKSLRKSDAKFVEVQVPPAEQLGELSMVLSSAEFPALCEATQKVLAREWD